MARYETPSVRWIFPQRLTQRSSVRCRWQLDGNAGYRRLGLYLLGYEVLGTDGSPAPGFGAPRDTIVFDRLPRDSSAAGFAYADGSQSGYQGKTVFDYIVTNQVRNGDARVDFWDPAALAPGAYTVRVYAEDFHGNRAIRDVPVVVTA